MDYERGGAQDMLPEKNITTQRETRLVDIGGRRLSLTCAGTGSPVVLLDAGLGGTSLDWDGMLDAVAGLTRACCYDRAGMGSSDPRPKQPHTTQDNVDDLHALLHSAAIPAPYLLVGHSQGGFTVSLYAYQHPDEVAGLVVVDPPHPDNYRLYLEQFPWR
jgi:pimeloyl-ACP methyl ester carboxylesterase